MHGTGGKRGGEERENMEEEREKKKRGGKSRREQTEQQDAGEEGPSISAILGLCQFTSISSFFIHTFLFFLHKKIQKKNLQQQSQFEQVSYLSKSGFAFQLSIF